jgi:hypothetical protein
MTTTTTTTTTTIDATRITGTALTTIGRVT